MSVAEFNNTIKSHIYKDWLKKLDKNIVTGTVKSLRESQEVAEKTAFYITETTVKKMYHTVTGLQLSSQEAKLLLEQLAKPGGGTSGLSGVFTKVGGSDAVMFESIGFDTISTKLVPLFNSYPEVEKVYHEAEDDYVRFETQIVNADKNLNYKEKQALIAKIEKEGKRRGSFGYFFNKGHVIGVATNLAKQFRDELNKADILAENQRKELIAVLDLYINKLQKDDLKSANLPNAVNQEIYASYTKSSDKYLVEIQFSSENQEAGRQSIAAVEELRDLFRLSNADTLNILNNSKALGQALISTPGSPSYVDLIATDLANVLSGKPKSKTIYTVAPTLVAKKTTKINKPKKNTEEINKLKNIKSKLQQVKKKPDKIVEEKPIVTFSLLDLQTLINTHLQSVVSANMGEGTAKNILNYRTGRFAASTSVVKLTESREGMITAFYEYMKNPYQTFEPGYRQGSPKTRDPKLLIATSIREIAAIKVNNRLRAVSV